MPDAQAAHEKTLTALLAAQGGANLIYGAGMLELGMTFDLAQLIIDSEIFKMVLHTINGFAVNDETLALNVIKEVGTGEFVSHPHTSENYRKIQSHSDLIDRQARDAWVLSGSRNMTERCYERAIYLLENHIPDPLSQEDADYIRKIIEDAEIEYGVK